MSKSRSAAKEARLLTCSCGVVRMRVDQGPILADECCCTSCREAARRLQAKVGVPNMTTETGTTHFVLYRKDRVRITDGTQYLADFRLKLESGTRRVLATCCNTPLFMELNGSHWLSIYAALWPIAERPAPVLRTMAVDHPDRSQLPNNIPNYAHWSVGFMWSLFRAWAAMGFRRPQIGVKEKIDA